MKAIVCPSCKVGLLKEKFFNDISIECVCNECNTNVSINAKYYIDMVKGVNYAKKKEK
jgi:rubredoxin